jgi:DNA adenine methylase
LAQKVLTFNITVESVKAEFNKEPGSLKEKAFQTLLKSRVYHGGILAPGSGLLKKGENGKGIRSRWYPETLWKRILDIARHRDRITFVEGDGLAVLRDRSHYPNTVYFLDPPYTAGGKRAGTRLYTHSDLDHRQLFQIANTLIGDFLMTYDDALEIRNLAAQYHFQVSNVSMENTHHNTMGELLVGRSLSWLWSHS